MWLLSKITFKVKALLIAIIQKVPLLNHKFTKDARFKNSSSLRIKNPQKRLQWKSRKASSRPGRCFMDCNGKRGDFDTACWNTLHYKKIHRRSKGICPK
jgi:hypothetical protein